MLRFAKIAALMVVLLTLPACKQTPLPTSPAKKQLGERALTLKQAYNLAKPVAVTKIGQEADIFNAISTKLNKDGTSEEWVVSFGAPSKNRSVAILVKNGRIASVSPVQTINPEENEDVTPLGSGWIDSAEAARAVPEAWEITDKVAFHWYFDSKAENEEGATWQLIAKNKFWHVDLYSGKVVNQGEQKEEIRLPVIK